MGLVLRGDRVAPQCSLALWGPLGFLGLSLGALRGCCGLPLGPRVVLPRLWPLCRLGGRWGALAVFPPFRGVLAPLPLLGPPSPLPLLPCPLPPPAPFLLPPSLPPSPLPPGLPLPLSVSVVLCLCRPVVCSIMLMGCLEFCLAFCLKAAHANSVHMPAGPL